MSSRVVRALLRTEPLDLADVIAAVAGPRVGGLGVFLGTVRDHDEGRSVSALTYEAHPSAARVLADVAERFAGPDVLSVAVEHRLGPLQVGDAAVVVVVAAEHRAQALTVCHALIDAVKSEVPIWKRQVFPGGGHEWVGAG